VGTDVLERRISQARLSEGVPLRPFSDLGRTTLTEQLHNVDESAIGNLRRNVNPTHPACNETQCGSTLFGMGAPAAETIPSHLSHELNSAGSACFVVLNLGMEGYVINQVLIFLVEALKTQQRPDM
jgi:hypothetical protein